MADVIVADALGKVYGTGNAATKALDSVSFTIEAGEFVSIIGQSGSGKSTLLNLLGLLDTPTSGTVTIDGVDTSGLNRKKLAKVRGDTIGFVFQFHHLLPEFSVFENLTMPLRINAGGVGADERERAMGLLDRLGVAHLADKNAGQLSGGQKQRVAIGRALIQHPAVILADEPTGNLDTENTSAVYDLLRDINKEQGTAMLIVTHDRTVAEMTDRILEVRDGNLVQDVRNDYALDSTA
jgi:lipoprotein-releasing system ATP-binding protein